MSGDESNRSQERERVFQQLVPLFEVIPDAVFVADVESGRVLYSNPAAARLLGRKTKELVGLHQTDLHPPELREDLAERFRSFSAMPTGRSPVLSTQVLRADGGRVDVEIRSGRYRESDGTLTAFGIFRDVSELHATEERLLKAEGELARIARDMPGGIFRVARSPEGSMRVISMTEGVYNMLGVSCAEVESDFQRLFTPILEEDLPRVREAIEESVRNLTPLNVEFRVTTGGTSEKAGGGGVSGTGGFLRAGGSSEELGRWLRAASMPKQAEDGTIVWNGVLLNVTDQKRREEERFRELEAKSRFLSQMSHEMRTPLNGILGMADLLREPQMPGDQQEYAEVISSAGRHLLSIVNRVLDFAKIEAGKLQIGAWPVDLLRLVEESLDVVAREAQDHRTELVLDIAPNVPRHVISDAGRLRQVLLNLLGNAVKFTDDGWIAVELRVRDGGSAEHTLLEFCVQDTGAGIPEEDLPKLFTPFEQAGVAASRSGGTGLGLSITKRLIEAMGGTISVESSAGLGTSVTFTHPVAPLSPAWPRIMEPDGGPCDGAVVLHLQRHSRTREAVGAWLEAWGCRTRTGASLEEVQQINAWADGGGEASTELRETPAPAARQVDVVLLEAAMLTDHQELSLLRSLVLKPHGAEAPVVLICAELGERIPVSVLSEIPQCRVLHKPIKPTKLWGFLAQHLGVILEQDGDGHALPSAGPKVPRVQKRDAPDGVDSASAALPGLEAPKLRQAQVLVVDDDETNHLIARLALEREGHAVHAAKSAEEALSMLAANRFDIVFMDTQLPGMDGLETTRQIRRQRVPTLDPAVPIVALTGRVGEEAREKALSVGMNEFLTKPVSRRTLARVVTRWTEVARSCAPRPTHAAPGPDSVAGGGSRDKAAAEAARGGAAARLGGEAMGDHGVARSNAEDPRMPRSAFDYEGLLKRVGGDDATARQVLSMLHEDLPKHIAQCRRAVERANVTSIERLAHMIHNSAVLVGAEGVARPARELSNAAARGEVQMEFFADRLHDLSNAATSLQEAVQEHLAGEE